MHTTATLAALAASVPAALGVAQGFNYGATGSSGAVKTQSDFEEEFTAAAGLEGTDGAFTSARLYTMVQGTSTDTPIEAIPAAISTKTTLLLGLWASGGDTQFSYELAALKNAISTYGSELSSLVVGISVGSEDLYRDSESGIAAEAGVGVGPTIVTGYIEQVRDAISGTVLADAPIGHVDTWTAWANGTNTAVAAACDWVGVDAYPYFQSGDGNSIENAKSLFDEAIANVNAGTDGKEIWVTETGWPVTGADYDEATASTTNARTFWEDVGCPLFGVTNTWWYILQDTGASPSFGVVGSTLGTTPLYDLSCNATTSSTSSSAASSATSSSSGTASSVAATSSKASTGYSTGNSTSSAGSAAGTGASTGNYTATTSSGSGSGASSTSGSSSSSASGSSSSTVTISGSNVVSGSISAVIAALGVAMLAL